MSGKGLSGIIALFLATAIGFYAIGASFYSKPTLDPIDAYCRGYTDGQAAVLLIQGRLSENTYRTEGHVIEESCRADLQKEDSVLREVLRGPILP
jgi:hypothetical protein